MFLTRGKRLKLKKKSTSPGNEAKLMVVRVKRTIKAAVGTKKRREYELIEAERASVTVYEGDRRRRCTRQTVVGPREMRR